MYVKQESLRSALDEIDTGVVMLGSALDVRFVNRAFRRMWQLENDVIDPGLDLPGLLDLVVRKRTAPMDREAHDRYVALRCELIRSGAAEPRDIRMDDGGVVRVCCKVLPDGGRMLTYTDVTDLVQQADRLEELATTDGMTALFNRRHFLSLMEVEWERHRRYGNSLSLLMIDIDKFKRVNDAYGHDAGDQVIVEIAKLCNTQKRQCDVAARFGGEEFMMLLPETAIADAMGVAERLRQSIATRPVKAGERMLKITVSIGVAEALSSMTDAFDMIRHADRALYAAKHDGRNLVRAQTIDRAA